MRLSICLLAFSALAGLLPQQSADAADAAKRPNILFAISDDQSFPHTSAYGCEWVKTPGFDRVAREGLLFMNCYTPNAKCAPSRSAVVTGRNSWQLEEAGNHVCFFPEKFVTYCEGLTQHTDYFVGCTGKGVAPVTAKGRNLTGKTFSKATQKPPAAAISNNDYSTNFEQFLDARKDEEKPFCFWFGATEPHRAYEYGAGVSKGGKSTDQIENVPGFWPDTDVVRNDMLDYAFEIEHFDRHLQRMIEALERRGELENTLIVVTSDNGMPFPRCKGAEYEYSNHMPLAIMWPAGIQNPGRKIDDYVSFIDFAPTFLELAGVTAEKIGMQPVQGKSLSPIFRSEKSGRVVPERNYVLLGQERHDVGRPGDVGYPIRSIIQDDLLYMRNMKNDRWPMCDPVTGYLNTDGSPTKTQILNMRRQGEETLFWELCFGKRGEEELYNIAKDPECLHNLIDDEKYRAQADQLQEKLFAELKKQEDPRMSGQGEVFDNYPYANPGQRNFYRRFLEGDVNERSAGWVNPSDFEPKPVE
ncbi:sulfatase [Rubinisphaera sp. JC750]|uniref:sulfatase family protein n=1 Tax=Rubinisphaera sp. JC750 TaxID=2898658 RepID=UPI001F426989|nr:sulfatase [Rubinisphaera sp. JC750]